MFAGLTGKAFAEARVEADFNGDGFDDLAIEVSGNFGSAGSVNVIYGSASGLTSTGDQLWNQDSPGILDSAEGFDSFGSSLTAGDFNGDGFDDLAVGVRDEGIGIIEVGAVNVIYGSASGLTSAGNQFWNQNSTGILDTSEEFDRFGSSLTAGDFDGDGFDDLAIGVVSEDILRIKNAGAVNVIYGSASGLTSIGDQFWHQDSTGILDTAEGSNDSGGDSFGSSLTAGDFDGDGFDDLAVGVSGEDIVNIVGSVAFAGAVNVIYGTANGLTSTGNQFWNQNSTGILDAAEAFDFFGASLTAGDFDGDGFDDLAVGVDAEDILRIKNAGAVNVIYGTANGLTSTGNQFWNQNSTGILDTAESDSTSDGFGDRFGGSLTAGDFDGDGFDDLAVGVPFEGIGSIFGAGAVSVIYGTASGLTRIGNQFWHQNSTGILGVAESNDSNGDRFGASLTAGDFDGDGFDDLAVGVPLEGIGSLVDAGAVNVIYGISGSGLNSAGNQFWYRNSPGIEGTAETGDLFGLSLSN